MQNLILTSLPSSVDKKNYLKGMVEGYLECAQWTNEDLDGVEPTFQLASLKTAINDCGAFLETIKYNTQKIHAGQMGHDFWLTRNGHGAGFWDRGLGDYGDMLTTVSKEFKSVEIELGDDNKICLF